MEVDDGKESDNMEENWSNPKVMNLLEESRH